MVFNVSDAATQACTECSHGQSCLQEGTESLCKVSSCVDGAVHFIACAHDGPCPYKQPVWDRFRCNCPVRREIYNKYKV